MIKIWKMNLIYESICRSYLVISRPDRTIEMMEEVLFLMQVQCLDEEIKPLLPFPIYLYQDTVKIAYMSDLIKVGPMTSLYGAGIPYFLIMKKHDTYKKMLNAYRRLTKKEIHEKVLVLLRNRDLDNLTYFRHEYYQDDKLRSKARLKIKGAQYYLGNFIRILLLTFAIAVLLAMIFVSPIAKAKGLPILPDRLISIGVFGVISFIGYYVWTRKWKRPTAYEKTLEEKDE